MVGQNIGKYRVLDRIGRGGMGTVYRALDETLHREVAIKVLNAELNDPEVARRFRAEAVTVARLNHPGIATIYELFQNDGQWLMVMEFVRGETLERMVERLGPQSPQRAADLLMQALAALAHAHSMGVVHRDLKPANLMSTEAGAVKIMDFGIARVSGSEHLTSAGFMMGTPAYMAPEQVLGQEIDARTDLYALGVVFYYLLSAKLPFKGETPIAMAQSRINDQPTPLRNVREGLPPWLEPVLERALSKQTEGRFQTADQFREALRRGLAGLPMDAIASTPTELIQTTPPNAMPIVRPSTPTSTPPPTPVDAGSTMPLGSAAPTVLSPSAMPRPVPVPVPVAPAAGATANEAAAKVVEPPPAAAAKPDVKPDAKPDAKPAAKSDAPAAKPSAVPAVTTAAAAAASAKPTSPPAKSSNTGLIAAAAVIVLLALGGGFWWMRHSANAAAASTAQAAATPAPPVAPAPATSTDPNTAGSTSPQTPPPPDPSAASASTTTAPPSTASTAPAGATTPPARGAGATPTSGTAANTTSDPGARGATAPGARGAAPAAAAPAAAIPGDELVQFQDAKVLLIAGKKADDEDVTVQLGGGQVIVAPRKGGAPIATEPYTKLVRATFVHARDPRWESALPHPADSPLDLPGVFHPARNWLVLQSRSDFVILRLDDANVSKVLDTIQTRAGLTIVRPNAGGD